MKNKNQKEEGLKYFIYCRKSSEDSKERQAQSIESQKNDLISIKKREGLKVVKIYEEERSAHTMGRPVFAEMMKALENGEANAILVWHPNRLTRNIGDAGIIITMMDVGVIREVRTTSKTYAGDSSTDKFVILLEFGISKKDSDDKSDVVKRGLKTKCEKGSMPGVAPIGYLNTPEVIGGSRYIKIDPERFEIIKQIWNMMATGEHSVAELWKYLNNDLGFKTRKFKREGNKSMCLSRLYKMFRDPFYYGVFEYPRGSGNFYKGSHEKMISEETFNLVQKILNNNLKTRAKTLVFDYTGTMRCGGCHAQITAEYKVKRQKNGNVHNYTYYRCTRRKDPNCKEPSIRLDSLDKEIMNQVGRITVPIEFEGWAVKYLKVLYRQELETVDLLVAKNNNKRAEIDREMDRLLTVYMSPENEDRSIIKHEEFVRRKKDLSTKLDFLEDGVANIEGRLQGGLLKSRKDFNFATYALEWLKKGTPAERKGVLSGLGSDLYLTNRNLGISLKKPFQILSDSHDGIIEETPRLEPLDIETGQEKTDVSASAFPIVLRGRDLHPRPSGYEPDELTTAPPRDLNYTVLYQSF
jgi:site-specific DNA recombinase